MVTTGTVNLDIFALLDFQASSPGWLFEVENIRASSNWLYWTYNDLIILSLASLFSRNQRPYSRRRCTAMYTLPMWCFSGYLLLWAQSGRSTQALSGLYEGSCMCWFCDGKVVGLLSPYSITVVYMPGTSIGFSVSAVSSSCLRTKEQGVVGEQGIVGLE